MKQQTALNKTTIGRADTIDFVMLGIKAIPAKIDTGAYRSAVHASDIKLSKDKKTLSFTLLGSHPICGPLSQRIEAKRFQTVIIENSFGHQEERYEVEFKVSLAGKTFDTSFTLANRGTKVFPVLIGRKLLNRRFVVDTSKATVHRGDLKRKYHLKFDVDVENDRV